MARPVGSYKDPTKSLQQEMLAWLSIASKIRAQVDKHLDALANAESTMSMDGRLTVLAGLKDVLGVTMKTVESGLKLLDQPKATEELDTEAVLEELKGGRG